MHGLYLLLIKKKNFHTHRYAIIIAAVTVSVSLAGSIPDAAAQEPIVAATNIIVHKKHVKPEKPVYVAEMNDSSNDSGISWLLNSGLLSLLDAVSMPKKLIGGAISYVATKIKSLDVKKLLKTALVAALVTVLGAVAAVAVAGLVSVVSGVCAVMPYVRFFFGDKGSDMSDSHMDTLTEFVLGAFNKYESHHKA